MQAMELTTSEMVQKARQGDNRSREFLLQKSKNFILKTASNSCGRYLDQKNDDEFSIAMIAFDEAIDTFDPSHNAAFYGYARMVIQRRLIDHYRKERRHYNIPLETDSEDDISAELQFSFQDYLKKEEVREKREEIIILSGELNKYDLNFTILEASSPKHKDSREKLIAVARILAENDDLFDYLEEKKRMPQKKLAMMARCSLRFLERGRAYIIAMALIYRNPGLVYLRSYLGEASGESN